MNSLILIFLENAANMQPCPCSSHTNPNFHKTDTKSFREQAKLFPSRHFSVKINTEVPIPPENLPDYAFEMASSSVR